MGDQRNDDFLVVNQKNSGATAVIHRPDCWTIRHQMDGDIREEYPRWDYEPVDTDDDGLETYRKTIRYDIRRYEAVLMTPRSLKARELRYRGCGICHPDIVDHNHPKPYSIEAAKLEGKHLGKEFIGWGILEGYSITGRLNEGGTRTVTVDARFKGGVSHRFDPDARLEYPRPTGGRDETAGVERTT